MEICGSSQSQTCVFKCLKSKKKQESFPAFMNAIHNSGICCECMTFKHQFLLCGTIMKVINIDFYKLKIYHMSK